MMSSRSNQACVRCRQQKRRCDKGLPVCALCKRLSRICRYQVQDDSAEKLHGRPLHLPDSLDLTPSNIRSTLEGQISKIIGDGLQLRSAAIAYFQTIHTWLPIISEYVYFNRLSQARVGSAPADFSLLTLSMFLACQVPVDGEISPKTRSVYVQIKSLYSMVEAIGTSSLDMLQCRLLLTTFEVGHAMYPAAYVSAGANVRAAVALGANTELSKHTGPISFPDRAEETRKTWQGIVMVDRYASLESGKGLSGLQMVSLENSRSHTPGPQINSWSNQTEAFQLLQQVLVHVYEGNAHQNYNLEESLQTFKTLTAFLTSLQEERPSQDIMNSAMAVCRSAMLELLGFGCRINRPDSHFCNMVSRNILMTMVDETVDGASSVLSNLTAEKPDSLSVFIPHFIYRTALLFLEELTNPERGNAEHSIKILITLLEHIGQKWVAGNIYADKISKAAETYGLCI